MFFLHKDSGAEGEEEEQAGIKKKKRSKKKREDDLADATSDDGEGENDLDDESEDVTEGEQSSDEEDGGEGPPLMYVLNLVNTKQDNTVKRYVHHYKFWVYEMANLIQEALWSRQWLFALGILFFIYTKYVAQNTSSRNVN
jgi:cobalamin biosynthesis protein CobT